MPPILTAGLTTNSLLQIIVTAEPNFSYVLQASSNLVSWVPISTNTALGGSFKYVDPNTHNFKYRFYRAVRRIP